MYTHVYYIYIYISCAREALTPAAAAAAAAPSAAPRGAASAAGPHAELDAFCGLSSAAPSLVDR